MIHMHTIKTHESIWMDAKIKYKIMQSSKLCFNITPDGTKIILILQNAWK